MLTIPSIINYFQDCSTFHSEDLGVGIDYLADTHKVWMLTHWKVVIEDKVKLGQNIQVGTWAYDFDKLFGYRNFIINDENGRRCVSADSKWILFDIDKGRPARITEEDIKMYGKSQGIDLGDTNKKLFIPEGYCEGKPFPVSHYHLDTNGHVNNSRYIQMAMEFVDSDREIQEFLVDYKKQAVLGDIIQPYIHEDIQNENCTIALVSDNGETVHSIMQFKYRKK